LRFASPASEERKLTDPRYLKPGVDDASDVALEEMFELGKEICKAKRFGWNNRWPAVTGESNLERAVSECSDVIGAATRLRTLLIASSAPAAEALVQCALAAGRDIDAQWPVSLADMIEPKGVKPHMGRIQNWRRVDDAGGLGYVIVGRMLDHERFKGSYNAHTSYVVKHDEKTGEIETRNSRYTLVGPENFRDAA
jgi:hypothetical protein